MNLFWKYSETYVVYTTYLNLDWEFLLHTNNLFKCLSVMQNKSYALTFTSLRNFSELSPNLSIPRKLVRFQREFEFWASSFKIFRKMKMTEFSVFVLTKSVSWRAAFHRCTRGRGFPPTGWLLGHLGVAIRQITPRCNNLVTCDHKHGWPTLATPAPHLSPFLYQLSPSVTSIIRVNNKQAEKRSQQNQIGNHLIIHRHVAARSALMTALPCHWQ